MLQEHNKHINNILWDILDDKVRECEAKNEKVREQKHILKNINKDFDKY